MPASQKAMERFSWKKYCGSRGRAYFDTAVTGGARWVLGKVTTHFVVPDTIVGLNMAIAQFGGEVVFEQFKQSRLQYLSDQPG